MTNIEMVPDFSAQPKIKVIGVGGAGGNAVNRMIEEGLEDVDFITINTDAAALEANRAARRIQIGEKLTKGLGAGANPEVGRAAIEENREELQKELMHTDMVFIAAGMGGGTGTGAAPVVAEIAKKSGALTVAVVTKPFLFEGKVRDKNAKYGIDELRKHVDSIIIVENQKLLAIGDRKTSILDSFKSADGVLNDATGGITNLITKHGLINVDFADVKAIMTGMGDAIMGVGESDDPENRAIIAAEQAIKSPLLGHIDISGALGLLVNFTAGPDLSLLEVEQAHQFINDAVGEDNDTNIIFGAIIDPEMSGRVQVTVVATGFNKKEKVVPTPAPVSYVAPTAPVAVAAPVAQAVPVPVTPVTVVQESILLDAAPVQETPVAPVATAPQPVQQQPVQQQPTQQYVQNSAPQPIQQAPAQSYPQSQPYGQSGYAPQNSQSQPVRVEPLPLPTGYSQDNMTIGSNLEVPAFMRNKSMDSVVAKDYASGEYRSMGNGVFPGSGSMGDIETPAFLRQQMQ